MKTRKYLSVIAAILLALSLVFVITACGGDSQGDTNGTTEPVTEPGNESGAPTLGDDAVIFFNPDRKLYEGLADDSLTARPKSLDDGYFHIQFASEGKMVELLAKKRMVVNQVDTNSAMGLQFDEKNNIVGIYTLEEIGGTVAIDSLYVTSSTATTLTINTNNTFTGEEITFNLATGAKIYDVSDKENNYGGVTELLETDEIYAIADSKGDVTHVWVLSRASQRNGRGGCICGVNEGGEHKRGCDGSLIYIWQPWTYETSLPTGSGYYYLDVPGKKITLKEYYHIRNACDIYIDLNGHTIVAEKGAIYLMQEAAVASNMTILDSTGGGKIKIDREEDGSIQSTFFVHYGKKHVFTMYGGTIDCSAINGSGGNGGILRSIGGTMNLYGGKIIPASGSSNTGGVVWSSGVVNVDGIEIVGGKANKGGNIFMQLDSSYTEVVMGVDTTLNIISGKITNGNAKVAGGNIFYMEGVKVNIADGVVSGGKAPEGADIHMQKKPTAAD